MPQGLPPGTPPPSPQDGPDQGPSQGAPQQQGPDPQALLQMIQKGFQGLAPLIQQAGKSLPPEDIQLFSQAQKMTEALIASLTQESGQDSQAPQDPGASKAPIPANASPKGSAPANFGGE